MEEVGGPPDWAQLGLALAQVHRAGAADFGWRTSNMLGGVAQRNDWTKDWPTFYVERRLMPWISSLPDDLAIRLRAACDRALRELLDHEAQPSLVHGDLWSGNVVGGRWFIDPAVSYSDRELDLAFATVFGGIPRTFFDAYASAWPLDAGWERRRPALQLYHLLVHVELFGGGYARMVADRLDALGW